MTDHDTNGGLDRRGFFKTAGAGLSAAGLVLTGNEAAGAAAAQGGAWTEKDKLARIASCTWPIRSIFKSRAGEAGTGAGAGRGAGRGDAPPNAAGAAGGSCGRAGRRRGRSGRRGAGAGAAAGSSRTRTRA